MSKNPLVVGSSERPTDRSERLDDMNQPPRLRPNRDRHDWERILALNEAFGSSSLTEANKTWSTTCVFSASDYNTVAWTSGVIDFADGSQYSIGSGNTGNMTGGTVYWIYFDSTVSTTALQTTSTVSDLASDTVLVMCTAKAASSSSSRAFFVPMFGALQVSDINIAVNSISTNMIQANAVTVNELSVAQLSGISADLGTITAGTISGTAIFGGTVSSNTFTGTTATFSGYVHSGGGSGAYAGLQNGGSVFVSSGVATVTGYFRVSGSGECEINVGGTQLIAFQANKLGFFNTTPVGQKGGWSNITNGSTDRTYNADATSVAELADVVYTLVEDLKSLGLFV